MKLAFAFTLAHLPVVRDAGSVDTLTRATIARGTGMFQINEAEFVWAVSKAVVIVLSSFASIIALAWVGHKKIFPE